MGQVLLEALHMRTSLLVVSSVLTLAACQFEAHVGGSGNPQTPVNANTGTPVPAPVPDPNAVATNPTPTTTTPTPGAHNTHNPLTGVKVGAANPAPPFDPRVRPQFNTVGVGGQVPLVPNQTDFGGTRMESDSMVGLVYFLPNAADKLPDLGTVQPTYKLFNRTFSVGPQSFVGFNVASGAPRNTNFAVRYTGSFNVAKAGDYSLYLESKEGARLTIDGAVAIDNDGVHGRTYKNADFTWTAGAHTIMVDYFAGTTNDIALELWVSPKGLADGARVWSPQVSF
jgi:PA14 domain